MSDRALESSVPGWLVWARCCDAVHHPLRCCENSWVRLSGLELAIRSGRLRSIDMTVGPRYEGTPQKVHEISDLVAAWVMGTDVEVVDIRGLHRV